MPGTKRSYSGRAKPQLTRSRTVPHPHRKPKNRMVAVPRNRLAFPQSMKTRLRYVERCEFSPQNSNVLAVNFLANGLFDPRTALGGHQPRGFDEFMNIYETFTVLGSSCSVSFMYEGYDGPSVTATTGNLEKTVLAPSISPQAPALSPMVCLLHKGTEVLAGGTAANQMEKDRTQWTYINGQSKHSTLSSKLKTSDFFGKEAVVGAEGYTGSEIADPKEQVLWQILVGRASDDYPADSTKVVAFVCIEYDTVFTEPKVLPES